MTVSAYVKDVRLAMVQLMNMTSDIAVDSFTVKYYTTNGSIDEQVNMVNALKFQKLVARQTVHI